MLSKEEEMINSIPKFISSNGEKIEMSNEFLKKKLLDALTNEEIIPLSRGEGRPKVLNKILIRPELVFNWGEKSMHAYLDGKYSKLREFCDPYCINKKILIYYIDKYSKNLNYWSHTRGYFRKNINIIEKMQSIKANIIKEVDNKKLLLIKEWLIYAFHTSGLEEFSEISPCMSCSYGKNRFKHGNNFGRGRNENPYYIIFDLWVNKSDEGINFQKTQFVNEQLKNYEIEWFSNRHDEVMLKYAIFPHQLIGYYLMDRGNIIKYVVNENYLRAWEENEVFSIGDDIYIDQNIDFNELGPYRTVYEYEKKQEIKVIARLRDQ